MTRRSGRSPAVDAAARWSEKRLGWKPDAAGGGARLLEAPGGQEKHTDSAEAHLRPLAFGEGKSQQQRTGSKKKRQGDQKLLSPVWMEAKV